MRIISPRPVARALPRTVFARQDASSRWAMRPRGEREKRAARTERLGLAATSLVLLLGIGLSYAGQTAGTDDVTPLNLSTVTQAEDLLPWLDRYADPVERRVIADALVARLSSPALDRIEHVGALASVRLEGTDVAANPRLVMLNERRLARPDRADVPVLNGSDIAAVKPHVIVRTLADYRASIVQTVLIFMLSFWAAHLVRWWRGTTGDPVLLPIVHLLTGLGLMAMIAMRDPLRDMVIAWPLALGIAVGCAIWIALSVVDFEDPRLRSAVLLPLGIAIALAFALLVFGSGPAGSGAKVNLLGAQPVEAVRLLVAFALAAYFARRWQFLRAYSEGVGPTRRVRRRVQLPRWKDVRPLAFTIGTLLIFFFLQKDLGPALVLSCVFLGLYGIARARPALVAGGFAVLGLGFAIGWSLGIPGTVSRRVAIWLDPWENAIPGGDQVSHALWALATGGLWGVGPGFGDPQMIPAGHTDLVVAALGEELGFVGVLCVLALFALLVWRMLRIALRAPGDYTFFLCTALTVALAAQAFVIVAGVLGILPLAGVVTPFLSYGRSAMLSNFAAIAICATVSRREGPAREPFVMPAGILTWTLAVAAMMLVLRTGLVQVVHADDVATRANLTRQADGGARYQQNPRLLAAARTLPRGTIFDRNGVPLATSRPDELEAFADRYRTLGASPACADGARCYPLGGAAFHVLGDAERRLNWAARNTSFAEQDFDRQLTGFSSYAELLPLVRHRANPRRDDVQAVVSRSRDLHLTIDAGLQLMAAKALRARAIAAGSGRGAAVVVDPSTGELLASASYPWPEEADLAGRAPVTPERLLDRARYGLYPPGSTFKLVTAVAALRSSPSEQHTTFQCVRLPDGRVGGRVPGVSRPVRDDLQDTVPHGAPDLHRALVVSCNAYFANLAQRLGPDAIADAARAAQIAVAPPGEPERLPQTLPHAGYGQGDVVASPLRMARVGAALAADGTLRDVTVARRADTSTSEVRWLSAAAAAQLRRDMRGVITSGTGRALAKHRVPIAGKTGTAQVDGAASHAWFVGFAPYDAPRIAFAVLVENAGYGGRVAAPLAGEIVSAAEARGLLRTRARGAAASE